MHKEEESEFWRQLIISCGRLMDSGDRSKNSITASRGEREIRDCGSVNGLPSLMQVKKSMGSPSPSLEEQERKKRR